MPRVGGNGSYRRAVAGDEGSGPDKGTVGGGQQVGAASLTRPGTHCAGCSSC
jgi:hypothetical protein